MTTRRAAAFVVVLALAAAGSGVARARLARLAAERPTRHELLYLPNGKHLRAFSFGQAPLVSSVLYLWAIQYYSDYDRKDRYRYVEHIFGDVIAELDPHYVDPYWLGAMILVVEAGDLPGGLRLLDKGFARNPTAWVLPYMAGWECNRVGDYVRAGSYFAAAGAVPSAPRFIGRLRAGMTARAGDLRGAIVEWRAVLDDPQSDSTAKDIARRQIRDLTVKADIRDLERAVAAFREAKGRLPRTLEEAVQEGHLATLPVDPDGDPYVFDRATGKVSTPAGRLLGAS